MHAIEVTAGANVDDAFAARRRTADRIFRGTLVFNTALTVYWLIAVLVGSGGPFFGDLGIGQHTIGAVAGGILFFYVFWGFVWFGIKAALLRFWAQFTKDERRQAFSSRMDKPFDVAAFTSRHSERVIRIIDMIGRRGRFILLGAAGFYYLYKSVAEQPTAGFATVALKDNLLDAVITSWIFLAFYYSNNFLAAAFYGPQSRIMDGVLARANCLLITTLWTAFKFVMVPLGARMAVIFQPAQFPVIFALIWGSYIVCDALSEIGGALFGKQTLRVWGIGDVNRKSVGGTVTGLAGALAFCLAVVLGHGLGGAWIALAVVIAVATTALELFSPRGTDDFTMATANALICWVFGELMY
jgi:hypothetical protein